MVARRERASKLTPPRSLRLAFARRRAQLPLLGRGFTKKIKSIQKFHLAAKQVAAGDRCGICLPSLDAGSVERGIACTPGSLVVVKEVIAAVRRVRRYSGSELKSGEWPGASDFGC